MRVLMTGNQGYLGTVMSPVLTAAGHQVAGLDSGLFAECVLGQQPVDAPTLAIDLRDVTVEQLRGYDAVIHLAALSNDPLGAVAPDTTYDINHRASLRLAELAKEAGVQRFLYASTCSVYGAAGAGLVTEQASLNPLTPYAISKVKVEHEVAAMADDTFSPTFLRNATAFGYSPRLRADIVVNNLVGSAVLTGEVLVLSDGTPWRPLVHARDIAAAFLAVLDAPREVIHCGAYNVGSEENNVTVAQIAEIVADVVPGSKVRITGEYGADPRSYRVDFSAIRAALPDLRFEWDVRRGAQELYQRYTDDGLTSAAFTDRFTRLTWLKQLQTAGRIDESMRPVGSGDSLVG